MKQRGCEKSFFHSPFNLLLRIPLFERTFHGSFSDKTKRKYIYLLVNFLSGRIEMYFENVLFYRKIRGLVNGSVHKASIFLWNLILSALQRSE